MTFTSSFDGDKSVVALGIFVLTLVGNVLPWVFAAKCCRSCTRMDEGVYGGGNGLDINERFQRKLQERLMNVLSCLVRSPDSCFPRRFAHSCDSSDFCSRIPPSGGWCDFGHRLHSYPARCGGRVG
jgi:hypothetical protein